MPTRLLLLAAMLAATCSLGAGAGPVPPVQGPAPAVDPGAAPADGARSDAVVLPVDGPVARFFVRPAQRWSRGHRGVDLLAAPGDAVRSPVSGVVEFAGPVAGRTVLTVVRGDGLRCSLEPLAQVVDVGTVVAAGDVVGVVAGLEARAPAGSETPGGGGAGLVGHCAPTSCVHWGVRRDGEYVDPLGLLHPAPVVLLPWR